MKRFLFVTVFILAFGVSQVNAQPAMAPELAMAATMAPEPVAMAPTSSMATQPTAMDVKSSVTPKEAAKPTPQWKTASFWILSVALPIILFLMGLLVSLGVFKKKWLQWLREKNVVEIADKVVTQFEGFARGTSWTWDDVLAHALKAVVVRLGELSDAEENRVRKVVESRKEQASKET